MTAAHHALKNEPTAVAVRPKHVVYAYNKEKKTEF
jgi:hypothetical protein